MTIAKTPGPNGGPRLIAQEVAQWRAATPAAVSALPVRGMARAKRAAASAGGRASVSQPLKLFLLHLPQIKGEAFLAKAKHVGWRYLLVEGGSLAVADVGQTSARAKPKFRALIEGSLGSEIARAGMLAAKHCGKLAQTYEARVLEVPALSSSTLWLRAKKKDADVFIPLFDRGASGRARMRVDARFRERLREAAEAARKERDATRPGLRRAKPLSKMKRRKA